MKNAVVRGMVVIAAVMATGVAAGQKPIAVVTDLRGDVKLQRAGRGMAEALGHTEFLFAGDRLLMGEDGRATLFQRDAPPLTLGASRAVTLQPLPASASEGVLTAEWLALLQKQIAAATTSREQKLASGTRGAKAVEVTALAPRYSLVLEAQPVFEWKLASVGEAAEYRVTLYGPEENKLWEATTRETRLTYPADRRPLAPGEYAWEVIAQVGSRKALDTAPFTITAEHQAAGIRRALDRAARLVSDPDLTNLPYVAVCLEHRLYPQAEAALKQATARAPQDRTLRALLMRLYALTERTKEREGARPILIDAK
jgi:uncharacterized protein (DUF2141 family)